MVGVGLGFRLSDDETITLTRDLSIEQNAED